MSQKIDNKPVGVLLVGGTNMFRELLAHTIAESPDMVVVSETADLEDAGDSLLQNEIGVAIVMIGTLGEQSLEFVRRLKEVRPTAKVIVLTDDVDVDEFIAVVGAGADSYIGKDSSLEQLMQSFKAVNLGGCVFECGVCGAALRKLVDNQRDDVVFDRDHIDLSGLSNRERQVAELLSRGHSNKEIASALSISVSTT